jgi:putative peptidoglycan lipid II flippase
LPHFSRLVAAGDWVALRSSVRVSTIVILCATVPIACLIWADSASFVRLVFQHGAFTAADTRIVGRVQAAFALGIPAYTLASLYMRLISALRLNQRIFVIASGNVALNFVLDVVFARFLGVAGIALSTSLVSLSSCVAFYFALRGPLARAESVSIPDTLGSDLAMSALPAQEAEVFGLGEPAAPQDYIAVERRAS